MAKISKTLVISFAVAAFLPAAASAATLINFESGYTDNQALNSGTTLLDSTGALSNVTLTTNNGSMSVEKTGRDSVNGFINDTMRGPDHENDGGLNGLGDYFLRTTNALSGKNVNPVFELNFAGGASAVSGEIWDIDGINANNSEGWDVVAYFFDNTTSTLSSPIYSNNNLNQGSENLDGQAWEFSFENQGIIAKLEFVFTGSKTSGIGTAVDNLRVSTVPLPASALLLLAGVGGLGAMRRFKK